MITIKANEEYLIPAEDGLFRVLKGSEIMDGFKPRKSTTKATKLSRFIGLVAAAKRRGGKWATGGDYDVHKGCEEIARQLNTLTPEERKSLTSNARKCLIDLQIVEVSKES